jgi:3-oxosteroid 1-dehydrogenase
VAAFDSGAIVIILEKSAIAGGTSAKSGGQPWIPNNFALLKAGIEDGKTDCLRFMARGCYPQLYAHDEQNFGLPQYSYDLLEAYYDNASKAIDFFKKTGACEFVQSQPLLPDYVDHAPENKVIRGRLVAPTSPQEKPGVGADLIRQLHAWIGNKKIPLLTRHRVNRLLTEGGVVTGVEAVKADGSTVTVKANLGVIFASGGFTHNPQLMLEFQRGPSYGGCAVITNTGDFVSLAQSVGAGLGNMQGAWSAEVPLEQALEFPSTPDDIWQPAGDSMVLVNKYGVRVVNEKRSYNDRARVHFDWDPVEQEYPNQVLCMIYDQRTADLYSGSPEPYPLPPPGSSADYVISGRTLPALVKNIAAKVDRLAPRIGCWRLSKNFEANLRATIKRFNNFAEKGVDEDFQRGAHPYDVEWQQAFFSVPAKGTKWPLGDFPNITMHPFTRRGPYYCILVAAGTLDTNGGPMINTRAQVLDSMGHPISGLYGAGNCIRSPMPYYIAGGSTLGNALTFGYIAGMSATALSKKPEQAEKEAPHARSR